MFVVLVRSAVLYLLIIVGIRLLGKRQVGELEPSELVLALILSDLAAVPMQDNGTPLLFGVIPIVTLLIMATVLSVLTMKSIRFRALLCGTPAVVIENGRVIEGAMRKNRLTVDELMEELRGQGYGDFSGVKLAVLETNGQLSVLPCAAERPVTAGQLGLTPQETGAAVILISDGRLLEGNLKRLGYERHWLEKKLKEQKVTRPEEVFLMTVDETGRVYCAVKEGQK